MCSPVPGATAARSPASSAAAAFTPAPSPNHAILQLGDSLMRESPPKIREAHACYLIGGLLPGGGDEGGREDGLEDGRLSFLLVGMDARKEGGKRLGTPEAVEAFYRADILDFLRQHYSHYRRLGGGGGGVGRSGLAVQAHQSGGKETGVLPPRPSCLLQYYRLQMAKALAEGGYMWEALDYAKSVKAFLLPFLTWDGVEGRVTHFVLLPSLPPSLAPLWTRTLAQEAVVFQARVEDEVGREGVRPKPMVAPVRRSSVQVGKGIVSGLMRNLGSLVQETIHKSVFEEDAGREETAEKKDGGKEGRTVTEGLYAPFVYNGPWGRVVGRGGGEEGGREGKREGENALDNGPETAPFALRRFASAPAKPSSTPVPQQPPQQPQQQQQQPQQQQQQAQHQQQPKQPGLPPNIPITASTSPSSSTSSTPSSPHPPPNQWHPQGAMPRKSSSLVPSVGSSHPSSLSCSASGTSYASAVEDMSVSQHTPMPPPSSLPAMVPPLPPPGRQVQRTADMNHVGGKGERAERGRGGEGSSLAHPPALPPSVPATDISTTGSTASNSGSKTSVHKAPAVKSVARSSSAGGSGSSTPTGGSGGGMVGRLAGLLGIKKPVTADLGEKMEAYFDKDKNRWIFPGQDGEEEEEDASLKPPPTGPIGGVPAGGGHGAGNEGGNGGPMDALSAMMAPPPLRGLPVRRATVGAPIGGPAGLGMGSGGGGGGGRGQGIAPGMAGRGGEAGGGPRFFVPRKLTEQEQQEQQHQQQQQPGQQQHE
jgi:hypothetical protein